MTRDAPDRTDRPIVFGQPILDEAAIAEVVHTLRSGWLGRGPKVAAFEAEFADYVGAAHACALNSGSAALFLGLRALGIGPGDEVITTPLTFAATLHAIENVGATPVLADVDPANMNLDPEQVAAACTSRTRAIVPVHLAGRPCAMDEISALASARALAVIEDAAHAVGTAHHGRRIGSISTVTAFSFQASKNLTTGEGGMLTTSDPEIAERVRLLSTHGMSRDAWSQFHESVPRPPVALAAGYKLTMNDIQAALGLHQLRALGANNARRAAIARRYDDLLVGLPLEVPSRPDATTGTVHAHHLYTVLLDIDRIGRSRDEVREALKQRGVGTGVHYPAAHLHPYYRDRLGYTDGDFPHAERIAVRTLSLPVSPGLTDDDIDDVVRILTDVLDGS